MLPGLHLCSVEGGDMIGVDASACSSDVDGGSVPDADAILLGRCLLLLQHCDRDSLLRPRQLPLREALRVGVTARRCGEVACGAAELDQASLGAGGCRAARANACCSLWPAV